MYQEEKDSPIQIQTSHRDLFSGIPSTISGVAGPLLDALELAATQAAQEITILRQYLERTRLGLPVDTARLQDILDPAASEKIAQQITQAISSGKHTARKLIT